MSALRGKLIRKNDIFNGTQIYGEALYEYSCNNFSLVKKEKKSFNIKDGFF